MRNGNKLSVVRTSKTNGVCSIPMRNGNLEGRQKAPFAPLTFVAYLWGMETNFFLLFRRDSKCEFVAYLWGMETGMRIHPVSGVRKFVAYLWGMETRLSLTYLPFHLTAFVAYLWGMETFREPIIYFHPQKFVAYLWGMETYREGWDLRLSLSL